MFKCEICYDWCSRVEKTQQWWDIAKKDWLSLNGKDLPYYIAILAVLRQTHSEMFFDDSDAKVNHKDLEHDSRGYSLMANRNCNFVPIPLDECRVFYQTVRIFRNGAAHITHIDYMNPTFFKEPMNPEDSTQDFYRYAPFPDLQNTSVSDLIKIHDFIKETILPDVKTDSTVNHRIHYELYHVERGPLIDFLHKNMIELLTKVKCL